MLRTPAPLKGALGRRGLVCGSLTVSHYLDSLLGSEKAKTKARSLRQDKLGLTRDQLVVNDRMAYQE